jgi:23S rRNA (pseudouridine1915-N3)-methyltransferase
VHILFIATGKTTETYLRQGIEQYSERISRYCNFIMQEVLIKGTLPPEVMVAKEGEKTMSLLKSTDFVVLLDASGQSSSSVDFAKKLEQWSGSSRIVFVAGGAYGFSRELYERSNALLSLSQMTFTHQMVRLIFLEQLYRAFTIRRNEKYHH